MREIVFEVTGEVRTVCVTEGTLALLRAVLPQAVVNSPVGPLAEAFAGHLALDPLALVLPSLGG